MTSFDFQPIFGSYLIVLMLAAVLVGLLAIRPAFPSANRRRRNILHGLRTAVILLVVLALLRPTVVHTKTEPISATVAFLLDTSRSMRVNDVGGVTRFGALLETFRQSRDQVRRLAERVGQSPYGDYLRWIAEGD